MKLKNQFRSSVLIFFYYNSNRGNNTTNLEAIPHAFNKLS